MGPLAKQAGIDKAIGKQAQTLSLWRRLLLAVRERYPYKDDSLCRLGKWTDMEKGIQNLREMAVFDMIYGDLNDEQSPLDPDLVPCTQLMWRKFLQSGPEGHSKALAAASWWRDNQTVDEVTMHLRHYEGSLPSSQHAWVSAVEELSQRLQKMEQDMSYVSPARADVSAIRSRRFPTQEKGGRRYTPRGTL